MKPEKQRELIQLLLERGLSEAEAKEFAKELQQSPEAEKMLGRQLVVDGMLSVLLEEEKAVENRSQGIVEQIEHLEKEEFVATVIGRIRRKRVFRGYAIAVGMAAAALLTFVSIFVLQQNSPIAEVVSVASVEDGAVHRGMVFTRGESLRFATGLVEVDLPHRGRIILEGPAQLDFIDAMSANLKEGRLHMKVEKGGRGYRVTTPGGDVVDLGTEFGIAVDKETGEVEAHVLEGEIQAEIGKEAQVLLEKNQAIRFGKGATERIETDEGAFYSSLPPSVDRDLKMVHWSMSPLGGGDFASDTFGFEEDEFLLHLKGTDRSYWPEAVSGPFGRALSFPGKIGYGEADFPGIAGGLPRTVSFWLKVPKDITKEESFGIVSWGVFDQRRGRVWQISVNPEEEAGPIGCLRLGIVDASTVGTTDLRDDEWHHVAVVLYKASRPDVGKHVILYLDGKVEPISQRSLGAVTTQVDNEKNGVWLGRDITSQRLKTPDPDWGFFRGSVDELFIFEGALNQGEIKSLMKHNRLPK